MERFAFVHGIPKYKQIVARLKLGILSCQIKQGDRLPTARELSEVLGVNIATVARAYVILKRDGFLRVKRKAGTMVVASPDFPRVLSSRQSHLAAITDKTILDSLSQGYSPEELETTLRLQISQLQKIKVSQRM